MHVFKAKYKSDTSAEQFSVMQAIRAVDAVAMICKATPLIVVASPYVKRKSCNALAMFFALSMHICLDVLL
jgi:hypothetical protein